MEKKISKYRELLQWLQSLPQESLDGDIRLNAGEYTHAEVYSVETLPEDYIETDEGLWEPVSQVIDGNETFVMPDKYLPKGLPFINIEID